MEKILKKSRLTKEDIAVNDTNDPEYDPSNDKPKPKGRPQKTDYQALSSRQKKRRFKEAFTTVERTARENNLTVTEAATEIAKMDANRDCNTQKAAMFKKIQEGENPVQDQFMSVEKATALKEYTKSGTKNFDRIRKGVGASVSIPGRYCIHFILRASIYIVQTLKY